MALKRIPIGNNRIYTQKKGAQEGTKQGRETVLIGAERINVGIDSGTKEIAKDPVSGYNYERNAIVDKTIYDVRTQRHGCCFLLALETGKRKNGGWFPGAIRVADTKTDTQVDIKTGKSDTSQTVITVTNVTVKVLDLEYDESQNIWYKVDYNNFVGYIRNTLLQNVRYVDPTK